MAERETGAEQAELRISSEEARRIARLLRYVVSLNTTAGLVSPTERRLTTPTYRAIELAAQILEGKTFKEAVEASEAAWTGSLEHDHRHALDLVRSNRDALHNAMAELMHPKRFAQYLEISQDQFLELIKSGIRSPRNPKAGKTAREATNPHAPSPKPA